MKSPDPGMEDCSVQRTPVNKNDKEIVSDLEFVCLKIEDKSVVLSDDMGLIKKVMKGKKLWNLIQNLKYVLLLRGLAAEVSLDTSAANPLDTALTEILTAEVIWYENCREFLPHHTLHSLIV